MRLNLHAVASRENYGKRVRSAAQLDLMVVNRAIFRDLLSATPARELTESPSLSFICYARELTECASLCFICKLNGIQLTIPAKVCAD